MAETARKESIVRIIATTVVTITLLALVAVAVAAATNIWGGLAFFTLTAGGFVVHSFRQIPAAPPTRGVLTVFGGRVEQTLNEGIVFLPFYPWLFGFIPVVVTKVNQDLPDQAIRTPDLAELSIPVSLTWTPTHATREMNGTPVTVSLVEFLNSGGESGVKTILEDIVRERLRGWGFSAEEGPQVWQDAIGAQEEAAAILLKAILGDQLPQVHPDIPTLVLLKYFNEPRKRPTATQGGEWGNNWENVEEIISNMPEAEWNTLKEAVRQRREAIAKARRGNGDFLMPQLGIVLNRLNIGEIKPKGQLAEAAEKKVKEQQDQAGEEVELRHARAQIQALMAPPPAGPGFSGEQALEVFQTERGKVTKTIAEFKGNLSPETRAMIERIAPEVLARIFGPRQGGQP